MELTITYQELNLLINLVEVPGSNKCVVFLCGGSLKIGKERYYDWQTKLKKKGISSVSFDYSGINGSGISLEESSLSSRIKESVYIIKWIHNNTEAKEIIIFGASMGGYIGLGSTYYISELITKVILYAPAAYSAQAHNLKFDGSFTKEIRKAISWKNSLSYKWFRKINKPTLFIETEDDDVIPTDVTRLYKSIGKENVADFTYVLLQNSKHDCWGESKAEQVAKSFLFKKLLAFITTN